MFRLDTPTVSSSTCMLVTSVSSRTYKEQEMSHEFWLAGQVSECVIVHSQMALNLYKRYMM